VNHTVPSSSSSWEERASTRARERYEGFRGVPGGRSGNKANGCGSNNSIGYHTHVNPTPSAKHTGDAISLSSPSSGWIEDVLVIQCSTPAAARSPAYNVLTGGGARHFTGASWLPRPRAQAQRPTGAQAAPPTRVLRERRRCLHASPLASHGGRRTGLT